MSAHMATSATIAAIITSAIANRVPLPALDHDKPGDNRTSIPTPANADDLVAELARTNALSVLTRYPAAPASRDLSEDRWRPTYVGHVSPTASRRMTHIDIAGLCDDLAYQSCEHDT